MKIDCKKIEKCLHVVFQTVLLSLSRSLITFWMPNILLAAPKSWNYSIPFIVTVRIFNGALQGVHFPSMISLTSQVSGSLIFCFSLKIPCYKYPCFNYRILVQTNELAFSVC